MIHRPSTALALATGLALAMAPLSVLAAPLAMPSPGLHGTGLHGTGTLLPIPAQSGCEGECPPEERIFEPGKGTTEEIGQGFGTEVARVMGRGIEACAGYDLTWRVDCLSVELQRAADNLPKTSAYGPARAEVVAAAKKLQEIARANADPARPAIVRKAIVAGRTVKTPRPITPIAPERVAAANAQAEAVIAELSTQLLRSAPSTPTARVELARVAQAIDSSKILLRSS